MFNFLRQAAISFFAILLTTAYASPAAAVFNVTDFFVDATHANPADPHEVFSPGFDAFTVTLEGSFDPDLCYEVTIKRTGGGLCGSANSSGTDEGTVLAGGTQLEVMISPNAASEFRAAEDWTFEIKEREAGCTGNISTDVYGDDPDETPLIISGCNSECLLTGANITSDATSANCGDSIEVCATGIDGTGNYLFQFDLDGDGVFTGGVDAVDQERMADGVECVVGEPCCVDFVPTVASVAVSVTVIDLGTLVDPCEATSSTITLSLTDNCDDGNDCNGGETCVAGACEVTVTPPDCSSLTNDCNTGTCNATNGECEAIPSNNGGSCDDGNACTENDTCNDGTCAGSAVDCSGLSDECNTGTCNATSGECEAIPSNNGGSCDDGNACTENDTCNDGTCAGSAVDCSGLSNECNTGTCNATSGECEAIPVEQRRKLRRRRRVH